MCHDFHGCLKRTDVFKPKRAALIQPLPTAFLGVAASARALRFSLIVALFFLKKLADVLDRC